VHLLNQPSQLRLIEYVCWLECPCYGEASYRSRTRALSLDVDVDHDGPVPSWHWPI